MDCQTIVRQFTWLEQNQQVDPSWSHQNWWNIIFDVVKERKRVYLRPVLVQWVPAHQHEHLPLECITESMAEAKGTTCKNIALNRKADLLAKEAAAKDAAVGPRDQAWLRKSILESVTGWSSLVSYCIWINRKRDNSRKNEYTLALSLMMPLTTLTLRLFSLRCCGPKM